MRFKNKLHYFVKYLFIAFPFVELLFIMILNQKSLSEFTSLFSLIDNGQLIMHSLGSGGFASDIGDIISNIFNLNVEICYYFSGCIIWITGVYYFDILLDCLVLIPKMLHWLFEKMSRSDK